VNQYESSLPHRLVPVGPLAYTQHTQAGRDVIRATLNRPFGAAGIFYDCVLLVIIKIINFD